jgi:glutamyl-Q tRNA(Asp) synthetase
MEDIDTGRVRPEYEAELLEDLRWLGLSWEEPVRRQSEHFADYEAALRELSGLGLLYPCFCTRREIQVELARAASAPQGPDGPLYPGTCRALSSAEREDRVAAGQSFALRLNVDLAVQQAGPGLRWRDLQYGECISDAGIFGDVVLARKETPTSYHLAVVVDDALQGISLVTRGEDLLLATHLHRLLQQLLRLPVPTWRHHRLICDAQGRRLAKRDLATSLRSLKSDGWTPERVWEQVGLRM